MPPRKRMTGAGIISKIKNVAKMAHKIVKEQKLLSRGLTYIGHPKLAGAAALAGYGKRKKRRVS